MIVGPCARDKGKPVKRRGRKANEAKALSVRHAGRVAVDWRLDLRKSLLALVAMIAAAACTDATAPEAAPPANAYLKSHAKSTISASLAAPASLWSGYSTQSHHWSHITTFMTDFYYSWTSSERTWAGQHYDVAMSGSGSAWRAVNPTVNHLTYALLWSMLVNSTTSLGTGYYSDMRSWFASHTQYSLEKAFVHRRGASFNQSGRVYYYRLGTYRWAINPKDPGAIAYTVSRAKRIAANDGGIFFDEASSGDMTSTLGDMQEFASRTDYVAAIANVLAQAKAAVGSKMIMLNTAGYTTSLDSINARRAGAVHLEQFNNFKWSGMYDHWRWVTNLASLGVFVDVVSAYSTRDMAGMASYYPPGNSPSNTQRAKLWELASYYLSLPASGAKNVAVQLENYWSVPYSTIWTKAQEANIGLPVTPMWESSRGTDPLGQRYVIYARDFQRARIILRMQQGWGSQNYMDASAITINLPYGERWIPLNANGTVQNAITTLHLRNSEAVILLRGSRM